MSTFTSVKRMFKYGMIKYTVWGPLDALVFT